MDPYVVLFLSRHNTARSIMAEAILTVVGEGRFTAYSAGVEPATEIDRHTLALIGQTHLPADRFRPKHYSEFTRPDAPDLDFVFTLSDTAAGEVDPEWPGRPVTAHWSCPDPLRVEGTEKEKSLAFGQVYGELDRRLRIFANLPFQALDRLSLHHRVHKIGEGMKARPF
ncbi:MAG: arsenate reductase ArsC [Caenispirillum sp.]|nr:arsenate reductase ArsC [Caenispirillum sp.]